MIVRCSNCESAYTVSDDKVKGKKFAFSCPNCSYNNIIDNREESTNEDSAGREETLYDTARTTLPTEGTQQAERTTDEDETGFDLPEDEQDDTGFEDLDDAKADFDDRDEPDFDLPEREDETEKDIGTEESPFDDVFEPIEEDITPKTEKSTEKYASVAESMPRPDTIESSSADDLAGLDDEDESGDDITVDLDSLDFEFEEDEEEPAEVDEQAAWNEEAKPAAESSDEIDLSSLDDMEIEENTMFDEEEPEDDEDEGEISDDNILIDLDEFEPEPAGEDGSKEDDRTETLDGDISLVPDANTKPRFTGVEETSEDEDISIDLDSLDAQLVGDEDESIAETEIPEVQSATDAAEDEDEELTIDLDSLDAQLEESDKDEDMEELEDENIAIDLDSLDAQLIDTEKTAEPSAHDEDTDDEDESISIDLDSLDAQLIDTEKTAEPSAYDEDTDDEDESISIDLDSLDAELIDEEDKSGAPSALSADEEEDESISIDLDTLDAQLDTEPEPAQDEREQDEDLTIDLDMLEAEYDSASESNKFDIDDEEDLISSPDTEPVSGESFEETIAREEEDQSITVDLDSLDVELEDTNSEQSSPDGLSNEDILDTVSSGDDEEEESRLSLTDAGLTLSEFEEYGKTDDTSDEDELHLTADEVSIDITEIGEDLHDDGEPVLAYLDDEDLPEIDLENYGDDEMGLSDVSPVVDEDILDNIETYEESEEEIPTVIGSGYVYFTIDYSLSYSRLKAFLRLVALYYITFIPHFLVNMLYSVVSGIIGYVNNLVTLISGKTNADFLRFQEQSLRYAVSTAVSMMDVVEDKPPYAGRDSVDYELQLKTHPPVHRSRFLAGLRVSGIGIVLATLPHLVIVSILTCAALLFTVIGLVSILFTGQWIPFVYDFMVRYFRYCIHISAFMGGLVDAYPSFRFD